MSAFQFSRAICRSIPRSLATEAQRMDKDGVIVDIDNAILQHHEYVQALESLGIAVTTLEADEKLPDCVFVEDPAVVCDDIALLPRLGHESRRGETVAMKACLVSLGFNPVEMEAPACMDGGDVLFTGQEFFVGLSARTNEEGIKQLAAAFPKYPVHGVKVTGTLHLKSVLSMAGSDVIVIHDKQALLEAEMTSKASRAYNFLRVADAAAANCVLANGTLLVRSCDEFPQSRIVFDQLNRRKIDLVGSELAKVDGALTCCSILLK